MADSTFVVLVLLPDGHKQYCPFSGTLQDLFSFLYDWWLETDESTEGGMPMYVLEFDYFYSDTKQGTDYIIPKWAAEVGDWLDRVQRQQRSLQV